MQKEREGCHEHIDHMKIGNQILFRRGLKPILGKRYNTYENEAYKKITAEYEPFITEKRKERET